jgi:hypothetical protein
MHLKKLNRVLLTCGILLGVTGPVLAAGPGLPSFQSHEIARAAAVTPVGGALRLDSVQVPDTGETAAFALQRFQVFADDAEITIHGHGGKTTLLPAPKNSYFRGTVEGEADSRVFLAVLADGTTQGIVARAGDTYLIGGDGAPAKALGAPLAMQRIDPRFLKSARNAGFACDNEKLPQSPHPLANLVPEKAGSTTLAKAVTAGLPAYTARVAIETDFEFYSLFNDTTKATTYIGNLIGYASTTYVNELNTSLLVQSASLWTTSNDPWTQTSTFCGLMEFGKYWNQNKTGVSRTTAHFMSGKSLGGGIAWVGQLCSGSFFTGAASSCPGLGAESTPWGGGYGFTANITGTFDVNNPTVMWDIVAVSHEIGHNFNSPHTHCYNGLEGNGSPIDQCWTGETDGHGACYSGTRSLPGPTGSGSGTIMSYCHLLSGGMSNISLTFGTNFAYGVQPGREAARMSNYVVSIAAGNPSCLAPASSGSAIFSDGFESGTLGAWSGKTP